MKGKKKKKNARKRRKGRKRKANSSKETRRKQTIHIAITRSNGRKLHAKIFHFRARFRSSSCILQQMTSLSRFDLPIVEGSAPNEPKCNTHIHIRNTCTLDRCKQKRKKEEQKKKKFENNFWRRGGGGRGRGGGGGEEKWEIHCFYTHRL